MTTTVKAIALTDKSTKSLSAVAATLTKVLAEMAGASETFNTVTYDIEVANNELDVIQQNKATAVRTAAAELSLSILENEDSVLDDLMSSRNLAKVSTAALNEVTDALEGAQQDNAKEVSKAVSIAVSAAEAEALVTLTAANSKASIDAAQNTADLKAKDLQIGFMASQIASLEQSIKDEREARVAMADSASKASGVVVNTSK